MHAVWSLAEVQQALPTPLTCPASDAEDATGPHGCDASPSREASATEKFLARTQKHYLQAVQSAATAKTTALPPVSASHSSSSSADRSSFSPHRASTAPTLAGAPSAASTVGEGSSTSLPAVPEAELVVVPSDTIVYRHIASRVWKDIPRAEIVRVESVLNSSRGERYRAARDALSEQGREAREVMLWHATMSANPAQVALSSSWESVNPSAERPLVKNGIQFVDSVMYAAHSAYVLDARVEEKHVPPTRVGIPALSHHGVYAQLLLCHVMRGREHVGKVTGDEIPEGYDSVCARTRVGTGATLWSVSDGDRCLPSYLVTLFLPVPSNALEYTRKHLHERGLEHFTVADAATL